MRESSLITYEDSPLSRFDIHFVTASLGTPCSVEFNFEKVWEFKKNMGGFNPKNLRFYHVHPEGFLNYSDTDLNCIKGLKIAFGHPIYFSILTFEHGSCLELSSVYNQISFQYIDKKMKDLTSFD